MQQTVTTPPIVPATPSFAGLLASLTAPAPKTAWNNDDLADDVATLSYEHALRTHARYKSSDMGELEYEQPADLGKINPVRATFDESAPQAAPSLPASMSSDVAAHKSVDDFSTDFGTALEQSKKCASITIRLSKTECDQLRRRAAQAGLTVSAYLRSCTFEAETLRAQVKDVLAELRTATTQQKPSAPARSRPSWFSWLLRLMPRWQSSQRVARA